MVCKKDWVAVPSDIRSVQELMSNTLAALASDYDALLSLTGIQKTHHMTMEELEKSSEASENRLSQV